MRKETKGIVYIAGPMTGRPSYNYPAFFAEEERLKKLGYEVRNPARGGIVEGYSWEDYMKRGLRELMDCDYIRMLPDWYKSEGARMEWQIAMDLGIKSI